MKRLLISLAPALALVVAFVAFVPVRADAEALKVLTQARTGQFVSLDPVEQFDEESHVLVDMLYSKLLTYAYLERPYKLAPDLLTRLPELGADKLTYTFTLRAGVRFHDNPCFPGGKGRELTTDDVFYSLRRYADGRLNNKSWFAMEGKVAGLDAYRATTLKAAPGADLSKVEIDGFKKLDDHRFTIKLTQENPLFLFALAIAPTAVVPVETVQTYKGQFSVNPVGTGPFSIRDVERKGVLRFVKNAGYYGVYPSVGEPGDAAKGLLKDAGKKLPLVDVVEMPLIEESQPEALKFLRGELDRRGLDRANFAKMVIRLPGGELRMSDEFAPRFDLYSSLGIDSGFFRINMKDPLLGQNKALRQAIVRLFDTRGRIDVLVNGRGIKLRSIVPYDLPGNERDTGATYPGYDIAGAKKLLAEAGYPDGKGLPPLTLSYGGTDADIRTEFDFMKAKFAAAGIQLKPILTDYPTFLKNSYTSNFQIAAAGWVADYADGENFYQLLYGKNVAPGPNTSSFVNAAYDRAYEASRNMPNGPARYAYFKTMNDIILEEAPIILTSNALRVGVTQKWVSNFKRNFFATEHAFIDIDMALKKKGL